MTSLVVSALWAFVLKSTFKHNFVHQYTVKDFPPCLFHICYIYIRGVKLSR